MPGHRWFTLGLLVFAAVSGVGILLQRATSEALRAELAVVQDQQRQYARLRAEHARLLAQQPPPAELDRLRADHVALVRLRAEIEDLKSNAERMTRGPRVGVSAPTGRDGFTPVKAALSIELAADGGLTVDRHDADLNAVRQRLTQMARGAPIEILLRADAKTKIDDLRTTAQAIQTMARELGLKFTLVVRSEPLATKS